MSKQPKKRERKSVSFSMEDPIEKELFEYCEQSTMDFSPLCKAALREYMARAKRNMIRLEGGKIMLSPKDIENLITMR
ncbi:hypothetical protein ACFSCX_06065 [Bacillus salitolerans]|uniref:CopG family transcriptional regulator n=1 Tax=Bacillus salitolerans TaxID=1437434 RepID=A0ABW4LLZ9_9BACI